MMEVSSGRRILLHTHRLCDHTPFKRYQLIFDYRIQADIITAITATGTNFTLTGDGMSYLFHVDHTSRDLFSDHLSGPTDDFTPPPFIYEGGGSYGLTKTRREFPDVDRSDFRLPAIHILHSDGDTVSAFYY